MKKILLFASVLLVSMVFSDVAFSQNNVGIGTNSPDGSALLDLQANNKGLLVPRVNTTQMNAIVVGQQQNGLLVYNIDSLCFFYYRANPLNFWQSMCGGGGGGIGQVGPTGPSGADGATGPSGADGASGVDGVTGPSGVDGATGPSGADGASGADGVTGPTGADGPTGPSGGPVGPTGPSGVDGVTGPSGADGVTGPAGANGATGPSGVDGVTGPAGANGATGPAGANGATGPAGTNGATGPAGANGTNGATGPTGANGTTFKQGVSLGSVWTVSSATWANVTPMTFTFTSQSTSAMVIFSASGYGYTESMAYVQFRVLNNGTSIGGTNEKIQDYDDITGTVTPWSCSFTNMITGLVVGNNYTLQVQGQRDGIYGVYDALTDPSLDGHHMSLSVLQ